MSATELFRPAQPFSPEGANNSVSAAECSAAEQLRLDGIAGYLHDIRNPLVSVRGYAKMVLEERAGPLQETQKEYLTIVTENLNRIVRLLNELSEMIASEPLSLEALELSPLAQECIEACQPAARLKSVVIDMRAAAQDLSVVGEREKLQQAFVDLLRGMVQMAVSRDVIQVEQSYTPERDAQLSFSQPLEERVEQGTAPVAERFLRLSEIVSQQQSIFRLHGGRLTLTRNSAGTVLLISLPGKTTSKGENRNHESEKRLGSRR